MEGLIYIARHRDVKDVCIIIPLESNPTVDYYHTVLCHFIFGLQCIYEVI